MYGNLALILAPMGDGKTTLLRKLISTACRASPSVLVVDPARELLNTEPNIRRIEAIFTPDASQLTALAMLDLPEFSWAVLDDADSLLSAHTAQHSPLLLVLSHLKNLRLNVALSSKLPMRIPTLLRDGATMLIYRPFRDPGPRKWLEEAGLELPDDLGEFEFVEFDRRRKKYRRFCVDSAPQLEADGF